MRIVHELERHKWSDFVSHHPRGNVFQSCEMYDVYRDTEGYKPIFIAVLGDDDEVLGVLLSVIQTEKSFVLKDLTARAVIWGGPLVKDDDMSVMHALLSSYDDIVKSSVLYTEFRNLWDISDNHTSFEKNGYVRHEHLNFLIDLSRGRDEVFAKLSSSKRRQVRRGLEKAEIVIAEDESEITDYYGVLRDYYSEVIKKPLPPLSFFLNFHRILRPQEKGVTFLVKSNGETIGGIVCPITRNYDRNVIYELYVVGSREHDNLFPSVLATWAPIEWGARNGFDHFDFMGAGRPGVSYGVREFKAKFGGDMVSYDRFRKIHRPILNGFSQIGFRLWRLLH
ncbi:MAG: GNAT family N-acetyltransferase [candidate division WOR-3 bacterium]|nr:GNAT family N-acetyltransferase [candidate division WOR-3 bacterium]